MPAPLHSTFKFLFFLCWGVSSTLSLYSKPIIPGLEGKHPLNQILAGEVLIGELRCAACHEDSVEKPWARSSAPDLSKAGSRIETDYLRRFLANPSKAHPRTKMPDVLTGFSGEKRVEIVESLTHFLHFQKAKKNPDASTEKGNRQSGRNLFHAIGCVACHPAWNENGEEETTKGLLPLSHVSGKYNEYQLSSFLFDPLKTSSSGRMPDLHLTKREANDLAAFLSNPAQGKPSDIDEFKSDPQKVEQGKKYFKELNCAACHIFPKNTVAKMSLPLAKVEASRGCLSKKPSKAPDFRLDTTQRNAIAKALAVRKKTNSVKLTDKQKIDMTLTALNCISCHQRDAFGGPTNHLASHLQTTQEELGKHARTPPELTLAGAKLKTEWIHKVMFDDERSRRYQLLRMPNFGETNLSFLPPLLSQVDGLLPGEFTEPARKKRGVIRSAGQKLVGNKGLNCVACHTFNKKASPGFQGMDLLQTYDRLLPSWFYNFMANPAKFRPGIVMPNYWSDGKGTHLDVLEGNASAQIWAIWHYLSYGQGAPTPSGIHSPGHSLEVGDVVRTYRGRSRIAGYRGIAVGFPGGLNYAFNAETGTLSGLWKGDFISVGWGGQGAGSFNPRSRAVALAQDLSFHALPNSDAPWPLLPVINKENPVNPDPLYPKNLGYQFLGYSLDEDFVPTFAYRIGDVGIEDKSTSVIKEGQAILNRMLSISSDEPRTLHFRALVGKVEKVSETSYKTPDLCLTVNAGKATPNDLRPLHSDENSFELLLNLSLPKGKSALKLHYDLLR